MYNLLPEIDPQSTCRQIVDRLRKTFSSRNFSQAVIGVSGGVDSAMSLSLACKALGINNVIPVLLPYGALSAESTHDAKTLISLCGILENRCKIIDITSIVDALTKKLEILPTDFVSKIRFGNVAVRVRMIVLFDTAKKAQALVIGTENRSEHLLGYFTRFGDEASDIEPIRHLYKTQVYALAKYLKIPNNIITKPPSANLWLDQTDEGEFGFTYQTADQILYGLYDKQLSEAEIIQAGFSQDDVFKVKAWAEKNRFKHELPIVFENNSTK